MAKGLKLKVGKFWRLNPTFVENTGEKLVEGSFLLLLPPILNSVKETMKAYFCYRHTLYGLRFEQVILTILKLHICSFNGCFLI